MALTKTRVEQAKPREKRYRLSDGGGLVLDISPSGGKVWRFRYQRAGRDAVATLGNFPTLSLVEARAAALDLKRGQHAGDDPGLTVKRAKVQPDDVTFESLTRRYMDRMSARWVPGVMDRFRHRMEKDVFPVIGDMDPREIQPIDVRRSVAGIEARGRQYTANKVTGLIGQVLAYGVAQGLADRNVALDLRGGLDFAPRPVHRRAVTDRADLGRMLRDIWGWTGGSMAKPLLQVTAYTFQRPGEVAAMRWQDVDLDRALWTYTVTKVNVPHAVPLAPPVLAILRELHKGTGRYTHVFHSRTAKAGHVSDAVAVKLLRKIGWHDRQHPHGLRAVARTLIAEDLKVDPELIERQLSHVVRSAHGRAYNRTLFLPERTTMMRDYANYLDRLREAAC